MKERDLILNMLANRSFTVSDFQSVGFTAENTNLRSEDEYLKSEKITKNPLFFKEGTDEFDPVKFHNFYVGAGRFYNQLATQDYETNLLEEAQFSKDNMWVPLEKRTIDYRPKLVRLPNEHLVTNSLETIGKRGQRTLSQSEIAQTQKVYNTETGEWTDSPNDSFFGNFNKVLVLATYDEDVYDEEGNLIHQKGERKLNEDDLPYYETLGGRNIHGKQVLSKFNSLTVDGSFANKYDFFDVDDLKEKSAFGTIMRNATLVGSMYLPYVGPVIAGLSVLNNSASIMANLSKLALGDDNETLNNIIGWTKSVNRAGQTEYSQKNVWTTENIINLIGDAIGQLKEQRWIFNQAAPLLKGQSKVAKALQSNKNYEKVEEKMAASIEAGLKKTTDDLLKNGNLTGTQALELNLVEQHFKTQAKEKAAKALEKLVEEATAFGSPLSKAYMTGLVVQDTYSEAKAAGASDTEAFFLTLGYAAAEAALLNTNIGNWIIPEASAKKFKRQAIANALAKRMNNDFNNPVEQETKKSFVQKLMNIGKDLWKGEHSRRVLEGGRAVGMHALAEATEEVSEEFLADFSKSTLNAVRWLRGEDPLDMGQWQNMIDRYGMSAIGGLIGGGFVSATTDFKQYRDLSKMDETQAMHEILYMVNNDMDDEFIESLGGMSLGNKNLSANKIISKTSEGTVYEQGTEEDNQDLEIKNFIKSQVKLAKDILKSEGAKISTESLLNKLTMEDRDDFIKSFKYKSLQKANVMNLYLNDFARIQSNLVAANAELINYKNSVTDAEARKNEEEYVKQVKLLEDKIEGIRVQKDAYVKGTIAAEAIKDAVFEMNPNLHKPFLNTNIIDFAKKETGKEWNELSRKEQKEIFTKLVNYSNTTAKNDIHSASVLFHDMIELSTPSMEAAQEFVKNLQSYGVAYQSLQQNLQNLFMGDPKDTDAYLQGVQKFLSNYSINTTAGLVIPFINPTQMEQLEQLFMLTSDPNLDQEAKEEAVINLENYLFETLARNAVNVAQEFIDLEYIHPEVKHALLPTLKMLLEWSRGGIEGDVNRSYQEFDAFATELENISLQLEEQIEQIENLKNTPILEFLNQFKLNTTNSDLNLSKHLQKVFDMLDEAGENNNIQELFLDPDFIEDNKEAIKLLQLFTASVEGIKIDNANAFNPISYSKIVNEAYQKQGVKDYVKLAELDTDIADMILQDVYNIAARLDFIQKIHDINTGQKLREHDLVDTNKNYLLYHQTERLIKALPTNWMGDDDDHSAQEVLQAIYDSSKTLRALDQENLQIPKLERRKANIEMIKLENTLYEIFKRNIKNKDDIKQLIKAFAGVNGFFGKTGGVLNTNTKAIDDNAYIWYLAARAALRSSDFYRTLSESITDDFAYIPTQNLPTYLALATVVDRNMIRMFTEAYQETVVEEFRNQPEEDRKKLLQLFKGHTAADAFATDLLEYFASFDVVPQFDDMVFIEGIPGSGKSGGVFRGIKALLNNLDKSLLENVIYAHVTEDKAKQAADNIGLSGYKAMDKTQLMQWVSSEWRDIRKNPNNKKGTLYLYDDSFDFVDGKLVNKWKVNKISDAPKIMFIDEITHYNQQELDMLRQFAKLNQMVLITAGDMDQFKQKAYTTKVKYKGQDIDVSINRNYFPRTFKLGLTLRTLNKQMDHDILMMQSALSELKEGKPVKFNFVYLDDDKQHKGLYGVKTVRELNDKAKESIKNIFDTAKGKVGFMYSDDTSELYKYLMENYEDRIDKQPNADGQGGEVQYIIVETNNQSLGDFTDSLYTGVSRAEQGALVFIPENTKFKAIKEINSSNENQQYQLLSWKDNIKRVSEEGKKELAEIVKEFDARPIEIKIPESEAPETVSPDLPKSDDSLPPPDGDVGGNDEGTDVGMTKEEAEAIIADFDNKYMALQNPIALRNSDKEEFKIGYTKVVENNGVYTPMIELQKDGIFEITLDEFYKDYQLIDKVNNTPTPVYKKGDKLIIDESGTLNNIIINAVDTTADKVNYTISNIDGTNTRVIEQSQLQSMFKEYYVEKEPDEDDNEGDFVGDNQREFDHDPKDVVTGDNTSTETEHATITLPDGSVRMTHKLYSFNAFEMGIRLGSDGKVYYDGKFFDERVDNAIGFMHHMGWRPESITKEQYRLAEQAIAAMKNQVELLTDNSQLLEYFKNTLNLEDGEYNLIYAIKSTNGEQTDPRYALYHQGNSEELSYIYSDSEKAKNPSKRKFVLLVKKGKDTVFELTLSTLNSPLTRMQDRNENGELVYKDIYEYYKQRYEKHFNDTRNEGLSSHRAINDIIDKYDDSSQQNYRQDLINLFKLYEFTANGIFYIGNYSKEGKFTNNFIYGKNLNYGVQLVKNRGELQLNGDLQFGTTGTFKDLEEFAKNPRLNISSIIIPNQDMTGLHKNHLMVLISTNPNYTSDEELVEAYQNGDPKVKPFYILPPKATVLDWLQDEWTFFQNNLNPSTKRSLKGVGNAFSVYRILQYLNSKGLIDTLVSSDKSNQKVKEAIQYLDNIEKKWDSENIVFSNELLINNQTDSQLFEQYKHKYRHQSDPEKWARRALKITEQKKYLESVNNWGLFDVKNDKTIAQALSSFLVKSVWQRQLLPSNTVEYVKNDEQLKLIIEATEDFPIYFKTRKSKHKLGKHGEFTKILTEDKYTLFTDETGKAHKFQINAKIDTPTNASEILYQKIAYITNRTNRNWNAEPTEGGVTHITKNFHYSTKDNNWKLNKRTDGGPMLLGQASELDYLGERSILEGNKPSTIVQEILQEYSQYSDWMNFEGIEESVSKFGALIHIAYRNQGKDGKYIFIYKDRLHVVQTDLSFNYEVNAYISNASESVTIVNEVNGKYYEHTLTFKIDDAGNIIGVNDNVQEYSKYPSGKKEVGFTQQQYEKGINSLTEINNSKRLPAQKAVNRLVTYAQVKDGKPLKTLSELINDIKQYLETGGIEFNGQNISLINFKREVEKVLKNPGNYKEIHSNEDVLNLIKLVQNLLEGEGNFEENDYLNPGDIIIANNTKIEITGFDGVSMTGINLEDNTPVQIEQLTDYYKKENKCVNKFWKMI